tara:strand:- start:1074 stop:2834 length:1761 start_codon:yes stop_codon:yes gene_type:complete
MKISRLLNKRNLLIFISFFFLQKAYSVEPVDIWKIETQNKNKDNVVERENISEESVVTDSIYNIQTENKNKIAINEEKELLSEEINIVGIYDPADNDLSMDMWKNSNGKKILEITAKIEKINLSSDATEILNIAHLTNSHFPEKNITKEQFLKIKTDLLIKQKNLDLIESYLTKNKNIGDSSILIQYYINHYLSLSDLGKACSIFEKDNFEIINNYVSKFHVYCLINLSKREEAQLHFDLLKESGFEDIFFEKKFAHLMGYDETESEEISEESLLDFHLSHRINKNFIFEPKIDTSKLIWKYLSSSNLLENIDLIDLEDNEKLFTVEKATHEKNYKEEELFALYERFKFNINQLLTVEESYKLLTNSESRALIYQGILISKDTPEKIKLIKLLKNSFQDDEIPNAFDYKLIKFLDEIDEQEIPSNYTDFYNKYKKSKLSKSNKIKFNNKIVHQSKILEYFKKGSNNKSTEKDLESILKKIKKDKKYFFSLKDIIMLESLKSDGIKIPKKYENIYEFVDPNIPYDIQILINRDEPGLALLRLVEIIGQDRLEAIDTETMYFIVSVLNQLNLDKIRNNILLKVLPLKV